MTSAELARIFDAMTLGENREANAAFVALANHADALLEPYFEKNDALAIAALANHAPALLELVRACEQVAGARCDDRACHDGWHWNVCPKNDATRAFTAALAKVHAIGKEGK